MVPSDSCVIAELGFLLRTDTNVGRWVFHREIGGRSDLIENGVRKAVGLRLCEGCRSSRGDSVPPTDSFSISGGFEWTEPIGNAARPGSAEFVERGRQPTAENSA
jgi:hypothetical protein